MVYLRVVLRRSLSTLKTPLPASSPTYFPSMSPVRSLSLKCIPIN